VKDGQGLQVESVTYGWIDNIEERKKSILGMLHYKEAPGDAPIHELVELRNSRSFNPFVCIVPIMAYH